MAPTEKLAREEVKELCRKIPADLLLFALEYLGNPDMSAADILKLYNEQKGNQP